MSVWLGAFLATAFANNAALQHLQGLYTLSAGSHRADAVRALAAATALLLIAALPLAHILERLLLDPWSLEFLLPLLFPPLLALLLPLLQRLTKACGAPGAALLLPLAFVDTLILGAVLRAQQGGGGLGTALALALGGALGFALLLAVFHGLRCRLREIDPPPLLRGPPIELLCLALLAMGGAGLG